MQFILGAAVFMTGVMVGAAITKVNEDKTKKAFTPANN